MTVIQFQGVAKLALRSYYSLNSINSSVQFTMEYNKNQIPFLDILRKRNENGIWIDF